MLGLHRCTRAFSSCGEQGLLSSCNVRASHRGGFSHCRAQALGAWASVAVAQGLSSVASRAPEGQLSSRSAWAQLLHSIWDLSGSGIEPVSLALQADPQPLDHQGSPRGLLLEGPKKPPSQAKARSMPWCVQKASLVPHPLENWLPPCWAYFRGSKVVLGLPKWC